ncbi:MAG: SMC family ATPase, partial [Nocardioides sp.]|nr:SMC family ATPase [Nocardioides sp.]
MLRGPRGRHDADQRGGAVLKLHRLEISAFGPFAETSTVDFDRLSGAGLFLLSGATGAGKTSVLDAVCFALYGDVPGDRSAAKRLRCDQARPEQAPRVVLEATLSGRRFRFVRSPSWERAKKRGTGTTTEQASVVVAERMKGQWVTLSTRLDEAGHLVGNLVGMNLTQFTQVAMLPQGRFQTFLRARSEDRHALLQQLFRTGRFEDVERWLRERRTELRRRAAQGHHDIADLVSRISEVTDTALHDGWDVHDLSGPLREGAVRSWVQERGVACAADTEATVARVQTCADEESLARTRLDEATALATRRRRLLAARAEHDALGAESEQHQAFLATLADARRAAPLVGPIRALDAATTTRGRAEQQWADAWSAARDVVEGLGAPARTPGEETTARMLEAAARAAGDQAAAARALQPRERELEGLRAELARLADQESADAAARQAWQQRAAALPSQVADAGAAVQ